jgi:hypothetical protein
MANCVTCGRELHPEREEKYDYCTDRKCQEQNAKGLTILALGVNKAADHYQVLDERTSDKVASGDWVEEAASGTELASKRPAPRKSPRDRGRRSSGPSRPARPVRSKPATSTGGPWSQAQEDLALIYNANGMRPDEIAAKLGLPTYTVTQMILAAKNRAKP